METFESEARHDQTCQGDDAPPCDSAAAGLLGDTNRRPEQGGLRLRWCEQLLCWQDDD